MATSLINAISREAPPGFKWILVCEHCTYCLCFECLACCIKNSPACTNILQEWLNMTSGLISYGAYFREQRDLFRGIMTGGPNQGQVYISLFSPYLTYQDYCKIMHQVKHDGSIWITFECDNFKEFYYSWSGWLYLLMWQFCPRDLDFFNQTDRDAFKIWFHAEICEAAQYEAWFIFDLTFETSDLMEAASTSQNRQYYIKSNYYGRTCIPQDELVPGMMGSPFYESFSGLPPFADDDISPPASHLYDSDADSLDSVGEHNIVNRMEA